ncbi:MAG: hypothetical protein M1833_006245 [Piccolia ochrophora]|nr:MAG: hypothetical protein M1833_006245 [Piccolia ochrophora]
MHDIANQYRESSENEKYNRVADQFRFPYWDPLMPRKPVERGVWTSRFGIPRIFEAENVMVRRPEDPKRLVSMKNPLYQFEFPDPSELGQKPPIDWATLINEARMPNSARLHTIRTPGRSGNSDHSYLASELRLQASTSSTTLWQLFADKRTYNEFSNTGWRRGSGNPTSSVESWHDNLHGLVGSGQGGSGHMALQPVAAFDPIFWMHHCNVDRLTALYQALYPDVWIVPQRIPNITFVSPSGVVEGETTPLLPFRKAAGNEGDVFWNSKELADWTQVGFDVPGVSKLNPEQTRNLQRYIYRTYYWITVESEPQTNLGYPKRLNGVEALQGRPSAVPDVVQGAVLPQMMLQSSEQQVISNPGHEENDVTGKAMQTVTQDINFKEETSNKSVLPEGATKDRESQKMWTWNANIRVEKFALTQTFTIHIFLGSPNDSSPETWMTAPNQVGFTTVFANNDEAHCANCQTQRDQKLLYADVVPLTTALVAYLKSNEAEQGPPQENRVLESLEPEHVVPFLKERLEWRVVDAASVPQSTRAVADAGLRIMVTDRLYNLPSEEHPLGEYEESRRHPECTNEKLGGLHDGHEF